MGDATVLSRLMRSAHRDFPTVPLLAVAKEISLEDVRLGLEKMPDRFYEHPHTVLVITNLSYMEAPQLTPRERAAAAELAHAAPAGTSSYEYVEQIEALGPVLAQGWQTQAESRRPATRPSCARRPWSLYREDHEFMLDAVIPKPGRPPLMLRLHPRLAAVARAHVGEVQGARRCWRRSRAVSRPGGRLLTLQSYGQDPALEIVQTAVAGREPVPGRPPRSAAGAEDGAGPRRARASTSTVPPDEEALFRYQMHTLPSEIGDRIGTSTLFAAWNAVIYVNQIEDERLDPVVTTGSYLEATQDVLHKHGGLWFNDEAFVVTRL